MLSKSSLNPEAWIFILFYFIFATGVNKFISHWPNYVDCNGSYFD